MLSRLILSLAVLVVLATAPIARAEPLQLDPGAMRILADKAIKAGYGEDALEIIELLLLRDPQDATALILKSRALRLMGRYAEAEAAARAAYAAAQSDHGRFGAAMVLAQALSLQDRRIEAQLWLRRANEAAPNPRAAAIARRDFDLVRSQTPLRLTFATALEPSSNVNNGARDPVFELPSGYICPLGCLGTASGAALALSGLEADFGAAAEVRVHDSRNAQGLATATLSHGIVVLSQEAKTTAPTSEASDFTTTNLDLGWIEKRYFDASGAIAKGSVNIGRVWYGGAPLTDYLAAGLDFSMPLPDRMSLSAGIAHQLQADSATGTLEARLTDGTVGWDATLPSGARIGAEFGAGFTTGPSEYAENHRSHLALSWRAARPVLGMGLSATAEIGQLVYPVSIYAYEGRHDTSLSLRLEARLNQLDYMGFIPVVSLAAERNRSNIGLYDNESLGVGLGIESKF